MVTVIAESKPVARKHHRCDNCQCSIAPGETYHRARLVYDEGEPYVWKTHLDCRDLAFALVEGCYDDEGIPPAYEAEREYLEEWRGAYPHAVCRVELGWELARQSIELGWHYQVVRSVLPDGEESFDIHEAFPDIPRDPSEPLPITEHPTTPSGETVEDLKWALRAMLEDIDRHGVIDAADYPPDPAR